MTEAGGRIRQHCSQVNRLLEGLTADYDIIRTTLQDKDTLSYEQATSRLLANARGRPQGAPFYPYRPRANQAGAEENQENNASANAADCCNSTLKLSVSISSPKRSLESST